MPPQLTTLFEDLVSTSALANDANQRSAANNVLSFMYYSGHDVTILVSKNAGRCATPVPLFRRKRWLCWMAHLVERQTGNSGVVGSIPGVGGFCHRVN